MLKSIISRVVLLALALSLAGLTSVQGTQAQTYPPPVGSLSAEAPSTVTGSTTTVTATVLDNAGDPVEGAEVVFTIVSQPGSEAQWAGGGLEIIAVTDANGVARAVLAVGSTAGNIIVETVSGEKTSQVTVAATSGLPETGGLPVSEGSDRVPAWQIAVMALGAAALAGGLGLMAWRNRRA